MRPLSQIERNIRELLALDADDHHDALDRVEDRIPAEEVIVQADQLSVLITQDGDAIRYADNFDISADVLLERLHVIRDLLQAAKWLEGTLDYYLYVFHTSLLATFKLVFRAQKYHSSCSRKFCTVH